VQNATPAKSTRGQLHDPERAGAVLVVPLHGRGSASTSSRCSRCVLAVGQAQARRSPLFLKAALLDSLPLPWIAAELGWIVAEYGRQPWVIEGVLPTALGVSAPRRQRAVQPARLRRLLFELLVADVYLMVKYIRLGPDGTLGHAVAPPRPRSGGVTAMDYETLRLIWWALLGILLIGFAVMDGFDLGTGDPVALRRPTDIERRVVINTVGPVWEGNQVWLILGGGAIFAAWPPLYAAAFSGFYLAMFLVLAALILRPVGFKFRSKFAGPRWRRCGTGRCSSAASCRR
jgi:hypothetical protein